MPENLPLGVSLVGGASVSLLAIFFSNLPESLVGGMSVRNSGMRARAVIGVWVACAVLLAAAVVVGRVTAAAAPPSTALAAAKNSPTTGLVAVNKEPVPVEFINITSGEATILGGLSRRDLHHH